MKAVAVDFETYYDKEYSLSKMSVYQYTHDEQFDAYLVAVYNDDIKWVGNPKDFDWKSIEGHLLVMHNKSFDALVVERLQELGVIDPSLKFGGYFDTADMAAYLGCQRNLKMASKHLLGRDMSKATRTAMKGKTMKDVVAEGMTEELLEYGIGDAVNTFDLYKKYHKLWPENEQTLSRLNFECSQYGVRIDRPSLEKCVADMKAEMQQLLKLIPWVEPSINFLKSKHPDKDVDEEFYLSSKDMSKNKETGMRNVLMPLAPTAVRHYAKLAGVAVPSSISKDDELWQATIAEHGEKMPWLAAVGRYRSLNAHYCKALSVLMGTRPDDTFAPQLLYFGAHSGRFSGGAGYDSGTKFNPQNMPRGAMFGCDLRKHFMARPGHKLLIPDFSQIEARVLLWLAGDTTLAAAVEREGNLYQAYAKLRGIYKGSGEFKKDDPDAYQITKSLVLGAGFQLSAFRYMETVIPTGLFDAELKKGADFCYDKDKDVLKQEIRYMIYEAHGIAEPQPGNSYHMYIKQLALKIAPEKIFAFLRAKADIDQYRKDNPKVVAHWKSHQAYLLKSANNKDRTHEVCLRSGRVLTYHNPQRVGREIKAQFEMGGKFKFLHSGVLTNNEVQATARDILRDAWLAASAAGKQVLWTVHDEIIFEVKEDRAEEELKECIDIMLNSSPWAAGCPLGVEGAIVDRYTK